MYSWYATIPSYLTYILQNMFFRALVWLDSRSDFLSVASEGFHPPASMSGALYRLVELATGFSDWDLLNQSHFWVCRFHDKLTFHHRMIRGSTPLVPVGLHSSNRYHAWRHRGIYSLTSPGGKVYRSLW